MPTLDRTFRHHLERTVKAARDLAEDAAKIALEQLGVGEATPFAHLSDHECDLRRKLRIHGRQLGDARNPKTKIQEIDRLIEEVAYEHWHRMLFARFLAENNLLMYPDPDHPVAVTLSECEDLAADEGAKNGWELASRFAARMLPQIFRPDSPVFQLELPPEHQRKLELLLAGLPREVFQASDSLGWVYQFWQAKKKDEVNASEVKIGARELPAVTQLFTEPYMVAFLLDNSLGAWWAARRLTEEDLKDAKTEDDLRKNASLPGVPLEYLRFVKGDDGKWSPAAGTFAGWPENLSEFKMLDPCCGSGHFLVTTFLMLVSMRMEVEGLSPSEAVARVLEENVHGLEIDRRCVELAAFSLAFTAWQFLKAGGYRPLPALNVACSGLSVGTTRLEWEKLANDDSKLRTALVGLYEEFKNAPTLGSLIDPTRSAVAKLVRWEGLAEAVEKALSKNREDQDRETGVAARGLAETARILAQRYHLVITNVPYLARGKQGDILRGFCEKNYAHPKNELATTFLERCLELCHDGGTASVVIPQNWMFLTSYQKFRTNLLSGHSWNIIGRLGFAAFEIMDWWAFNTSLVTMTRGCKNNDQMIAGIDASGPRQCDAKAALLRKSDVLTIRQANQLKNPDARVAFEETAEFGLLGKFAQALQGISPADAPHYSRNFWELTWSNTDWISWQSTIEDTGHFGGKELMLWFGDDLKKAISNGQAYLRGNDAIGKRGIVVRQMRGLPCALHTGTAFDTNCAIVLPNEVSNLPAIWCFCSSSEYSEAVRRIDQTLKVTNATLVKVPFDIEYWTQVAKGKYPNGLPKPYSDDPTQWIFHGHPCGSVIWKEETKQLEVASTFRSDGTVLQVAVARLLGYRWPAEMDAGMELADEQREWVKRSEALLPFSDGDGILCIPPVRGEASAADRLLNLLAEAYGKDWHNDVFSALLKDAGFAGKHLETWFRDGFFAQHCDLFHQRPFIWQIWDGLRDGFSALVNYHKLNRKNLETLIYTYLGDWIKRQKDDIAGGVDGAQERLDAAEALRKRLELILAGEEPYDIFVRWKPLHKQPIGWEPDLNDGVRLNIRPFMTVPDVKVKGAGVLRVKPKIKWDKDRGMEPKRPIREYPWFWGWDGTVDFTGGSEFTGQRFSDCHYTLESKRRAHQRAVETEGGAS